MFNSKKFIESVFDEDWRKRVDGVRAMRTRAPRAFQDLLLTLLRVKRSMVDDLFDSLERSLLVADRKLPMWFSASEMNQGKEMFFHPLTGDSLNSLLLKSWSEPCIGYPSVGDWGQARDLSRPYLSSQTHYGQYFQKEGERLPLIGDGKDRKKGDPYPEHWRFDPFTGEELK